MFSRTLAVCVVLALHVTTTLACKKPPPPPPDNRFNCNSKRTPFQHPLDKEIYGEEEEEEKESLYAEIRIKYRIGARDLVNTKSSETPRAYPAILHNGQQWITNLCWVYSTNPEHSKYDMDYTFSENQVDAMIKIQFWDYRGQNGRGNFLGETRFYPTSMLEKGSVVESPLWLDGRVKGTAFLRILDVIRA